MLLFFACHVILASAGHHDLLDASGLQVDLSLPDGVSEEQMLIEHKGVEVDASGWQVIPAEVSAAWEQQQQAMDGSGELLPAR